MFCEFAYFKKNDHGNKTFLVFEVADWNNEI